MAMNAISSVTRVGSRMFSTTVVALLVLFGCPGASSAEARSIPAWMRSFLSALEWRFVGPYRGGRVVAVAGDANDPLVFYFGAAHGGVWKTTDAGGHWRNVSDGFFKFPAIGGLDVSLSDPDVIFAGTGEGLQRQFISPGDGVYKSTDGGETWTHVGLRETRHISQASHSSHQSRYRVRGGDGGHVRSQPGTRRLSNHWMEGRRGNRSCIGASPPVRWICPSIPRTRT